VLSSDVRASKGGSDYIYSSFHRGCYSHSTSFDREEWKIMFREFVASGLIVKSEPDSD
jgi:hypothetical protein